MEKRSSAARSSLPEFVNCPLEVVKDVFIRSACIFCASAFTQFTTHGVIQRGEIKRESRGTYSVGGQCMLFEMTAFRDRITN